MRWGVLSTALINRKLLAGAALSDAVEVLAVASREQGRADAFAREHGIARAYGSYDALLADPDVESVYVPLPNALHHPWTLRALRAGKHVLCEKPYSRHPAEVEAAFDLAETSGLVLSEAYMYRYHPQTVRVAELVAEGAVGELRLIDAAFTWPCDAPGDVRLSPELDGGSLLDVGCYCVSAARLLAGEPESVTAQQVIGPTGVEERLVGTLRFAGDVLAHFDSGLRLPDRSALEVVGTEGAIVVSDPWHGATPGLTLRRQGEPPQAIPVAGANAYRLELEHHQAAVAGAPSPLLGRADCLGQARTLAALLAAAQSGVTVAL